ncbi:MAG: glycoside hydrolase family 95 protein, partial [Lachnospiraceae bacterium]|nr:glycoside hydrolase family 95 protein [Lachnospiraceae bacterium]
MCKIEINEYAKKWDEALPIGNGRLGGMVYGIPATERIALNEDSCWFGGPRDRNNPSAKEKLDEVRQLIFAGKISEAQELCAFALSGLPEQMRHYAPLGDLYLEFAGKDYSNVTDYHRELDLDTAVASTCFEWNGVHYKREMIASYPANAMIIHLSADKEGSISFHAQLTRGKTPWDMSPYQSQELRRPNYNMFVDDIYAPEIGMQVMTAVNGGKGAVSVATGIKVMQKGGEQELLGNSTLVKNADEVTIVLVAESSFREENPEEKVLVRLQEMDKTWEEYLKEHLADYQELYNRVTLEIEGY